MGLTYELHIFVKEKYTYEYNRERGAYVVYDKMTGDEFNTYNSSNDDFVYVADNMKNRFGDYTIDEFRGFPDNPFRGSETPLESKGKASRSEFKEYETPLPGEFNYASDVFVIITGH